VTADVHLVAAEADAPVAAVCRVLDVPRSTAYARRAQEPSARQSDTDKLDVEIAATFREHKGRYGSPRVHPGCVSQGDTRAEALSNIHDAVTGYLASLKKHDEPIPPSIDEDVVEISA
jgi:predicted RNase H-like HicB family nuclease